MIPRDVSLGVCAGSGDQLRLRELCTSLTGSQAHLPGPQIPGLDCVPLLESVLSEMQQHRELEGLVLELRSVVPDQHVLVVQQT